MQDIPLYESNGSNDAPLSQIPADDVKVTDYRVMPWPDGSRVTVEIGFTPFRQFPAMDVMIANESGEIYRQVSMVGAIERRPAPTMWLPRLPHGSKLLVVIDMINNGRQYQQVVVPFEIAGPILKRQIDDET
jgi:hypothetical protein